MLSAAVRAVSAAWQKVLRLDPVERSKLATKVAAMAEKTEKVPALVQKRDLKRVLVPKTHQPNPDFEDFVGQKSDELDVKPQ